jgi:hypothetical protein
MAVTAPSIASLVVYTQGASPPLPGGYRSVPAVVLNANGLSVSAMIFTPESLCPVCTGVPHVSVAPPGSHCWAWPASSGNANA